MCSNIYIYHNFGKEDLTLRLDQLRTKVHVHIQLLTSVGGFGSVPCAPPARCESNSIPRRRWEQQLEPVDEGRPRPLGLGEEGEEAGRNRVETPKGREWNADQITELNTYMFNLTS